MWGNQSGYDAAGGDSGGGYMNSPAGKNQFGDSSMSQEKKRNKAQNLFPVNVAMVMNATQEGDQFMIGNIELHQVTLVGLVRTVKEAATRLDYQIDDMSGPPFEVRQFVDNDDNSPDEDRTVPMRENTYVRVFGHVRAFNNTRSIVAFRIVPILDMNELTTHLLEVVHSQLAHKKQAAGGETQLPASSAVLDTTAPGTYTGGTYAGAQADMGGLNPTQQQVSLLIKNCQEDQGINIQHICAKLRGIPQKAVMDALEFLSSEGHIYSTIDDEHFKSTDAC